MADTSSKQRMCTYLVKYVTFNMHLISRERHFHLQIMAHVHSCTVNFHHIMERCTKKTDFVRFKALVTGSDICQ